MEQDPREHHAAWPEQHEDRSSEAPESQEAPHEEHVAKPLLPVPRAITPVPRSIGRYHVLRQLGEGAMGRVFLARDQELSREVAIKVLRLEAAGNAREAYLLRFRNEARAAGRFLHPNVVAVYDAGEDPNLGPYLVYEYVHGSTLRGRIHGGRLELEEVVRLARAVASALDALHSNEILHRDVKPDNILLAEDGGIKLTDMGIARLPDAQLTREGQFLGTPAYAAPEAITRGEYAPSCDVFSLTAVLYEALCGIRPFPGDDAVSVSYAVANDTPPPPSKHIPSLPPSVDAVFLRGLSKKPNERFASAGELAGSLYSAWRASVTPPATATNEESVSTSKMLGALPAPSIPPKRPQHPRPSRVPEPVTPRLPIDMSTTVGRISGGLFAAGLLALLVVAGKRWTASNEAEPVVVVAAPPTSSPAVAAPVGASSNNTVVDVRVAPSRVPAARPRGITRRQSDLSLHGTQRR